MRYYLDDETERSKRAPASGTLVRLYFKSCNTAPSAQLFRLCLQLFAYWFRLLIRRVRAENVDNTCKYEYFSARCRFRHLLRPATRRSGRVHLLVLSPAAATTVLLLLDKREGFDKWYWSSQRTRRNARAANHLIPSLFRSVRVPADVMVWGLPIITRLSSHSASELILLREDRAFAVVATAGGPVSSDHLQPIISLLHTEQRAARRCRSAESFPSSPRGTCRVRREEPRGWTSTFGAPPTWMLHEWEKRCSLRSHIFRRPDVEVTKIPKDENTQISIRNNSLIHCVLICETRERERELMIVWFSTINQIIRHYFMALIDCL